MSVEDVSVDRGSARVLDGVCFDVRERETVGLLGPNGSGKSTLLHVLSGVRRPNAGSVLLDGAPLRSWNRKQVARRVALVGQHADTEVDVDVADVVRLGRVPHRGLFGASGDDARAVDAALDATGMSDLRTRRWRSLSGGERQRTQIARALAQEPRELVLDEPTNHLDIRHQLDILSLVRDLPLTTVVALHDLNLAAMFCDRVVVLDRGRVVVVGAPADVIDEDLVARVYGVAADITLDDGTPAIRFRTAAALHEVGRWGTLEAGG
ncbi:ABC transporter ATP-binding protein [Rhodococcus sp. HNM0569]|uniref:ABC transporter ATP-binding protein n=1 Tax=Rhodococcus sp. HNM0569 TaxID=2716340 RepID=UPI00146E73F2|nr:ABC transporter ATP-binding protein [Rhodococcus sp. HNM0569]NLU82676.1 ABC transporter ATP-binding protein [Rhodococcus sp. HNM0569]